MCESCKEFNEKKYPDLGEGSLINFDDMANLGVNADKENGIRLFQERNVTYMGADGVISKHEVECVYIPWERVFEVIEDIGELYMRAAPDMIKTLDWMRHNRRERGSND